MSSPRRLTVAPHSIPPKALTHRTPIEQAIACGESVIDICARLRVSEDDVVEVWLRMDTINGEPDSVIAKPRSKPGQQVHGTYGGYKQHGRKNSKPCTDCRAAYNAYTQKRRAARRATVAS